MTTCEWWLEVACLLLGWKSNINSHDLLVVKTFQHYPRKLTHQLVPYVWGGGEELEREVGVCMRVVRLDDGMHDGVIGVVVGGAWAIDVRFEGKKKDWMLILGGRREIKRVVVVVVVVVVGVVVVVVVVVRGIKESSKEL
ncbi:hypothetical protein ACQJBY_012468 [Aegilops geniculata]